MSVTTRPLTVLDLLADEPGYWAIHHHRERSWTVTLSAPGWEHVQTNGRSLGEATVQGQGPTALEAHADATRQRDAMRDPSYRGETNHLYSIVRADRT